MTMIFKAALLVRGTRFVLQGSSSSGSAKSRALVSLVAGNTRQVYEPLAQARFYSSDENKPSLGSRERLYDAPLKKKIRFVKVFSLATSLSSLLCQPYLLSKAMEHDGGVTAGVIILTFGFFTFGTPVLLHLVTKRYIIHVDYDSKKDLYIAGVYNLLAQKKEIEFTPADVRQPEMSEMLSTCTIKGIPMFMDVRLFTDVSHYKRIMGFDKPMDLNLSTDDIKTPSNDDVKPRPGS